MRPLILAFAFATLAAAPSHADDWMVRQQGMGKICHVQLKTASPLGSDLSGPHASRKAACVSAKDLYDTTMTNPSRCFSYGTGTVSGCHADHVELPK